MVVATLDYGQSKDTQEQIECMHFIGVTCVN